MQAVWSPQPDPHSAVLALHHAAALHSAEALHNTEALPLQQPQQLPPVQDASPPQEDLGNSGGPSLPSPEHLRTQVSQGKPSSAVASPSGTLGHVMLVRAALHVNQPQH